MKFFQVILLCLGLFAIVVMAVDVNAGMDRSLTVDKDVQLKKIVGDELHGPPSNFNGSEGAAEYL